MFFLSCDRNAAQSSALLADYRNHPENFHGRIIYPLNGTLFPPEIVPPTFRWQDSSTGADRWLIATMLGDGTAEGAFLIVDKFEWQPGDTLWESIKRHSRANPAKIVVIGYNRKSPRTMLSAAGVSFSTSADSVNDPIFYREVNLPFATAVKDPSLIRWRFGSIARRQAPIVLEKLPVCGNCHSFSADGKSIGMDVDYANDKGSYIVTSVKKEMILATSNIITWSDYKRSEKDPTFGLLSQVSPDGRFVVSTVKDRSVFVPRPDLAFSQLFFPIKGILAVWSKDARTFTSLPGADSQAYVQSNPAWSPDGGTIIFARSKTYELAGLHDGKRILLTPEECREFLSEGKKVLYDLYRMPFNNGKGGKAEPLAGASENGMSNYFARYSPDGRWIVFCQAASFMLLQPDSRLYIMPAAGGTPRLMRCNTDRMNSWHSWSSNSRWLVFSSKTNTPYTQLFITHINEKGDDTPPVLLEHFTGADRAANIPEFVHASPDAIKKINERFIDDVSYWRAGKSFENAGDIVDAAARFTRAVALNPGNIKAQISLGNMLEQQEKLNEAASCYSAAVSIDSNDAVAQVNLGNILTKLDKIDEAVVHYKKAIRTKPDDTLAYYNLGNLFLMSGNYIDALDYLRKTAGMEPDFAGNYYLIAQTYRKMGKSAPAIENYRKALKIQPDFKQALDSLDAILK